MKLPPCHAALIALVLLARPSTAAEMKQLLKVDAANFAALRSRFGTYGHATRQTIRLEDAGIRFQLPAADPGVEQTGLYSHFALAGDCEVVLTYELLDAPFPRKGYGCGLGLAFDIERGAGRGAIQRVFRLHDESGCVLQTAPGGARPTIKAEERFVPATNRQGRIGLRRIKKELIFLSAASPDDPLEEIGRLPFTDQTIRAVRVFADPGGSPTALDVLVWQLDIRGEEMASGVPHIMPGKRSRLWLWLLLAAGGAALLYGTWYVVRRRQGSKAAC